jgi:hypothetical protein
MKLTGENRSTRGKTCPSVTLSTTNPIWTDVGSNPGLRGGRPASETLQVEVPRCVHTLYVACIQTSLSLCCGLNKSRPARLHDVYRVRLY